MLLPVLDGPAGALFIPDRVKYSAFSALFLFPSGFDIPVSTTDTRSTPPVDFTLPDDQGRPFVYDAEFRARRNSVLVWYRGHW